MTNSATNPPAVIGDDARADEAIVVWRGERIGIGDLPARIARTDGREERDRLFGAYLEAVEALNPRLADRRSSEAAAAPSLGVEPATLAADLDRFVLHTETPYYAALRRHLAQLDIEQGDGTVADVWHIARGAAWTNWFGPRETRAAVGATGREPSLADGLEGWLAAEAMLRGDDASTLGAAIVGAAHASLAGSPDWVAGELGMAPAEVTPFVDFAAFVRLWRLRQAIGLLQYELRSPETLDSALARAYFGGILGHITGVMVPDELYLVAIDLRGGAGAGQAFGSAQELVVEILGAGLVETMEAPHGARWWRERAAGEVAAQVAEVASVEDALAQLGYNVLDWRPLLRQSRTRLIGEMSGYGGPNITTRAGTRKV